MNVGKTPPSFSENFIFILLLSVGPTGTSTTITGKRHFAICNVIHVSFHLFLWSEHLRPELFLCSFEWISWIYIIFLGLIISEYSEVEVYVPSSGQQCRLADLPDVRRGFSMEAKTVCGGGISTETATSCLSLTSLGTWERTTTLLEGR